MEPAGTEKWEQKRNIWKTRKVLCSNPGPILTSLWMRHLLHLRVSHPKKLEHDAWLENFFQLFYYNIGWKKLCLQFPFVKKGQDWQPCAIGSKTRVNGPHRNKLKAWMNKQDCNKLGNIGRAEFLFLLRPDCRGLANVSSLLLTAPRSPPPPPAATKPFWKPRAQHIMGTSVRNYPQAVVDECQMGKVGHSQ